MYIIYIYNVVEPNFLNHPDKQIQGLVVEVSTKPHDQWEYEWALSYCIIFGADLWSVR